MNSVSPNLPKPTTGNALRILLADDHDLVLRGLKVFIEREPTWMVCATAGTGEEAIAKAQEAKPDIAILDMSLPDMNGLEATRRIKKALPNCEILIFTGSESDELVRQVYESGAKGFVLKSEVLLHVMDAIRSLGQHMPFFTDKASDIVFARFNQGARKEGQPGQDERLTPEESGLVELLAEGHSNRSAAKKLKVSIRTIENQRAHIMSKLKLNSFADLIRYAVRNKIVEP